MTEKTVVNAGFCHSVGRGRGRRSTWKNVRGIVVDLPPSELCSKKFRDEVQKHSPGPEYRLEGYAIVEPE